MNWAVFFTVLLGVPAAVVVLLASIMLVAWITNKLHVPEGWAVGILLLLALALTMGWAAA